MPIARVLLSGSTNGRPVTVAATASAGTTIHTAVSGTTSFDEIYLWATNTSSGAVALTIEWGGTSNPGDRLVNAFSIPANSAAFIIVPGLVLNNSLAVKAFAGTASVILLSGYVNRIT